jgi:hypothetical protein
MESLIHPVLSFPQRREPRLLEHFWIPACAGMTVNQMFPEPPAGSSAKLLFD